METPSKLAVGAQTVSGIAGRYARSRRDSDILAAFLRYCHPEVVNEFQQLGLQHQQVWLDAFSATCLWQMQNMLGDRIAERMHVANPQALGPEDVDLNSILAQMHSSSTARGQADPCPLLRALKPQIRVDQSIWEDLVGPLRQDFLPSWGRKRLRQELQQRHQSGLLKMRLKQNSDWKAQNTSDATTQKPMATKSWTSLKPSLFADLPVLMVAEGKMVNCTVIDHPFVYTAVQALVEDAQGQVMPLQPTISSLRVERVWMKSTPNLPKAQS